MKFRAAPEVDCQTVCSDHSTSTLGSHEVKMQFYGRIGDPQAEHWHRFSLLSYFGTSLMDSLQVSFIHLTGPSVTSEHCEFAQDFAVETECCDDSIPQSVNEYI